MNETLLYTDLLDLIASKVNFQNFQLLLYYGVRSVITYS